MKLRYLPIDDRNNLRVLRHTTDKTVIEAILGSIFKRPYYTFQILWEYRKWFFKLSEEQINNNPALACGLAQLLIMSGDLSRAEKIIGNLPENTLYKSMSLLLLPSTSLSEKTKVINQIKENDWIINSLVLTAGRPSVINGALDFTYFADQMLANKEASLDALKTLYPDNYESIYDIIEAEKLYWQNDCYDALVKVVSTIPLLKEKQDIRILFAAMTLEIYILVLNGQATNTESLIANLREQIIDNNLEEYTPNIDALDAWSAMYDADYKRVTKWMRESAPDEHSKFCMLDLFRYMIKMRAYIISGKHLAITALASKLMPLLERGHRFMDMCELHLIWAMSDYADKRPKEALEHITHALELSEKYRYDRLIADEGKRALELIKLYEAEKGATPYSKKLKGLTEKTATLHPKYLKSQLPQKPALTETEMKVLSLLASGSSNSDISATTGMAVETAKIHCKHIFEKLEVKNRQQAVFKAIEYGIIEPLGSGNLAEKT